VVRLLEGQGWQLDVADRDSAAGLIMVGRRHDEIGLETTLRVHRMRVANQDAIEDVRRGAPLDVDIMVVVDEAVGPEQVLLAADNGVQLVDANQLAESHILVGQSA
jgi:hypothetical protein